LHVSYFIVTIVLVSFVTPYTLALEKNTFSDNCDYEHNLQRMITCNLLHHNSGISKLRWISDQICL